MSALESSDLDLNVMTSISRSMTSVSGSLTFSFKDFDDDFKVKLIRVKVLNPKVMTSVSKSPPSAARSRAVAGAVVLVMTSMAVPSALRYRTVTVSKGNVSESETDVTDREIEVRAFRSAKATARGI